MDDLFPMNAPRQRKLKLGLDIVKEFGDGRWHRIETIADRLDLPVEPVLTHIKKRHWHGGSSTAEANIKRVGRSFQVQIFPRDKTISVTELITKLTPIIEHLRDEGRKGMATVTIAAARTTASRLQKLLDEWAE